MSLVQLLVIMSWHRMTGAMLARVALVHMFVGLHEKLGLVVSVVYSRLKSETINATGNFGMAWA